MERFSDAALGWPKEGGRPYVYATAPATWKDGRLAGGVLYSHDGGATWRTANEAFEAEVKKGATQAPRFPAIATCLTDARIAYVSYREIKFDDSADDHYMGVARTEDGGVTWNLAVKDTLNVPSPTSTTRGRTNTTAPTGARTRFRWAWRRAIPTFATGRTSGGRCGRPTASRRGWACTRRGTGTVGRARGST